MSKRAIAVIGSSFGDEGKGLMTDYFCRQAQEKPIVVRYNGGAQAGHTVVTPKGERHVFHHFGAGHFAGATTYLSKHFLVNPTIYLKEKADLGGHPVVCVHPLTPVTTPYDMFTNQVIEQARTGRHGSCGMGIHETVVRHSIPYFRLFVDQLFRVDLYEYLEKIRQYHIAKLVTLGLDNHSNIAWLESHEVFKNFLDECRAFMDTVYVFDYSYLKDHNKTCKIIFEGAQGLLLDQDNKRFFPHVTHSKTGLHNVIEICQKAGIEQVDACYVARSYLTRHGAGELPGEDLSLSYEDNTNNTNAWQGSLRFAPQNWDLIDNAIKDDYNPNCNKGVDIDIQLAITHVDQCSELTNYFYTMKPFVKYESFGPTYEDIAIRKSVAKETQLESSSMRRQELHKTEKNMG